MRPDTWARGTHSLRDKHTRADTYLRATSARCWTEAVHQVRTAFAWILNEEEIPCLILQVTRISPGVSGVTCWKQTTLGHSHSVQWAWKVCLHKGPKEPLRGHKPWPWGWGQASRLRWRSRCNLNDDQESTRGLGSSGKAVSTRGVFQSEEVCWRNQPRTRFQLWTHCPAEHRPIWSSLLG